MKIFGNYLIEYCQMGHNISTKTPKDWNYSNYCKLFGGSMIKIPSIFFFSGFILVDIILCTSQGDSWTHQNTSGGLLLIHWYLKYVGLHVLVWDETSRDHIDLLVLKSSNSSIKRYTDSIRILLKISTRSPFA